MSPINLEILIQKLDGPSHVALEAALGIVASSGQRSVELAHWLYQLIQTDVPGWQSLLKEAVSDRDRLLQELHTAMESYPYEADATPTLSQSVIDAACEAWLIASLECGLTQLTPGFILVAILSDTMLRQNILSIAPSLKHVNQDALRASCIELAEIEKPAEQAQALLQTRPPKGVQSAIAQFTMDMTALAKEGTLDPVVGREMEIQQMIDVLLRRRQNNPILVGEPGVGKTACVEGLAQRMAANEVPSSLANTRLLSLDLTLMQAGASVKGEFEKRLKQLIQEVQTSAEPIILFIDEAHLLIGAGGSQGTGDAANILKPALARGQLRTVAATTWKEYKKYFETDAALTRRFQAVTVIEPSTDDAIAMLRTVAPKLQKHHGIAVRDEAVVSAVMLSHRYLSERKLPDKALSLLDTACARAISPRHGASFPLVSLDADVAKTKQALNALENEGDASSKKQITNLQKTLGALTQRREVLAAHIASEKILIDALDVVSESIEKGNDIEAQKEKKQLLKQLQKIQKNQCIMPYVIDRSMIAEVLSGWTGVPVSNMLQDAQVKLTTLSEKLKNRVHGQDQGIDTISRSLITSGANLGKPTRPLGVFLLVGPSGVGKTETAFTLAQELFGSADKMTTINMSEFKEAHKVSTLTGSPPGYVGYGEGGVLTEAVRRQPHSLVLLDEMEKAHTSVQDIFYQMLDRGFMRDSEGRDIDFKQTVVMMTANAADTYVAEHMDAITLGDQAALEGLQQALEKYFKPAFLGRVTVVPYGPLSQETLKAIIEGQLEQLVNRVKDHYDIALTIEPAVIEKILQSCQTAQTGARQVATIIDNQIAPVVATTLLQRLQKASKKSLKRLKLSIDKESYSVK